jgi:pimeloyl-ACP methyl ester carboxylesterase
MAVLREAFERAAGGAGGVVAMTGEAGIGKSRLVEELVADAEARGASVLVGRAYESDEILLFGPLVAALRSAHLQRDREPLDALGPVWRGELLRLLPELAAADAPPPSAARDYRPAFEAIAALVGRMAERGTVVFVLEDLHWADELSLRFVAFLARRAATLRLLVVATAREEELADASMLRRTLADLARAGQVRSVRLGALSRGDTVALVQALAPPGGARLAESLAERVWVASEGNPLVAVEMMRDAHERGWRTPPGLPERVREVIGRRIERLPDHGRTLVGVAAAIGRELDFAILRRVGGLDDEATAQAVEELVRRRVLATVGDRLGFAHQRIRQVVYGDLPPWRRTSLHRRIADAMEALHAGRLPDFWEALAEHCERGEAWARAAHYHLAVADRARARYAYATAERACEGAAAAAEAAGDAVDTIRARELRGDVLSSMGEVELANASYDAALSAGGDEPTRRRIGNKRHGLRRTARHGATLVFYEHGSGDETLLLTNPLLYGLEVLQPILEPLCQEFRIVTMDLRGTGRSDPMPRSGYTTGDHAADIAAVIEAAGHGPVTAIGISKSGNMLVRLAATAPALVKRLVIIGTPIDVTPGCPWLVRGEADDRFREGLRAGDLPRAMANFAATIITDPGLAELAEQFTRNVLRLPRESILSNWAPDPEVDIAPILDRVKAPTLVLHGTDDQRVSVRSAHYLAAHLPDARLHLFEGLGHLPIFSATAEFCEVLRRFVRGAPTPSPTPPSAPAPGTSGSTARAAPRAARPGSRRRRSPSSRC